MNLLLYIYIFLIGITFGSFFTLAVYRIPRGEDITHTRSYCPKCNHKLSFWDMIPLFSYIFLGAKCRYCKEKIRPRYFILEFCSGLVFVLFALSIKLNIYTLTAQTIIYFIFGLLYIAGLFIVSGIDKEKINIQNEVTLYLTIVEAVYIIYLCIVDSASIYRYVIYLLTLVILTMANTIYYKKKVKNNYTLDCLILLNIMLIFTYECCSILTVIFTLLAMSIKVLIDKINQKRANYSKTNKKLFYIFNRLLNSRSQIRITRTCRTTKINNLSFSVYQDIIWHIMHIPLVTNLLIIFFSKKIICINTFNSPVPQ